MTLARTGVRRFNTSGYEILDDRLSKGEVVIWSVDPVAPSEGDLYLIESDGRPYDVRVADLTFVKGGWCAVSSGPPARPRRHPRA
jgi:hypothetical protein